MGLEGILRIEEYFPVKDENAEYDPMLQRMYKGLNQDIFTTNIKPQPIVYIENLEESAPASTSASLASLSMLTLPT